MATLLVGVNASETLWQISAPVAEDTIYLKVGTEIVAVLSDFTGGTLLPTGATVPSKVRVKRGVGGTTKASHAEDAALTEYADASVFAGVSEGGGGSVLSATIPLSSADILALFDTPKVLVAGVAGQVIVPLQAVLTYHFGTVAYSGDVGQLGIGMPQPGHILVCNATYWGATEDTIEAVSGIHTVWMAGPLADFEDVDLTLSQEDDNPADGDGTMTVDLLYVLIDVT